MDRSIYARSIWKRTWWICEHGFNAVTLECRSGVFVRFDYFTPSHFSRVWPNCTAGWKSGHHTSLLFVVAHIFHITGAKLVFHRSMCKLHWNVNDRCHTTYKRRCGTDKQKQIELRDRERNKSNTMKRILCSSRIRVCVCVCVSPAVRWNAVNWVQRNSAKNPQRKSKRNEDKNPNRHRNFSSHQCQKSNIRWSIL